MNLQTQKIQKITTHLPKELLQNAQKITHQGITGTIKIALQQLTNAQICNNIRKFRGKVKFSIDLNELRKDKND